MTYSNRKAVPGDIPVLHKLIVQSARELCAGDYTTVQIEAALRSAWGVDTQLIKDGVYYVVEEDGVIVACGGWSGRSTLFGGDNQPGRASSLLDPATEPARIRAFFVLPSHARKGIGKMLLDTCERAAYTAGFRSAVLVATLTGQRLYSRYGYIAGETTPYTMEGNLTIDFVPMKKVLTSSY